MINVSSLWLDHHLFHFAIQALEGFAWVLVYQADVVGRHNHSSTCFGDALQQLHNAVGCVLIQIACRLVGDDELRMIQDGATRSAETIA